MRCLFLFFKTEGTADAGDKCRGELTLTTALNVEKADDREHDSADEVDDQVLHGIDQTDIDIAAIFCNPVLTVDDERINFDVFDDIQAVRVKHNRVDFVHNPVLLHIHVQIGIGGELEELPQDTDGHGKAECDDSEEQGRQLHREAFASVKDIHECKADGRHQKTVYGVQHGIPIGNFGVIGVDFSHNFGGEDETVDDGLECRGKVDAQFAVDKDGDGKQGEGEHADKEVLIVATQERAGGDENDNQGEQSADGHTAPFVAG